MKSIILGIVTMTVFSINAQDKAKLIYVGDPMCSWCYGFGDEMDIVIHELSQDVELEIIMGGLRPYNTQTMSELKDFLVGHWNDVNRASGKPFSFDILDTEFLYDTEPACRAVIVARELQPQSAMRYFHNVQDAFYAKNQNPHLTDTYADIASSMGMDREIFIEKYESEKYKSIIKHDFLRASKLGIQSFPTVLISKDGKIKIVSSGYSKASQIVKNIQEFIGS